MNNTTIGWIALDWGTTHLRAYALNDEDQVLHEACSSKGMGVLKQDEFEPALLELVADWLPAEGKVSVIACGMVGARQGWVEAPYQFVPCAPYISDGLTRVTTNDSRLDVSILPGVCQSEPPDVMRGEETQVAGLIKTLDNSNATICLPGTHSKWVSLSEGVIERFSTYMTGEMFMLLGEYSILRFSVGTANWDQRSFIDGVTISKHKPDNWLNSCFSLRAQSLLLDMQPKKARAYLSGLLIGAELFATENYWNGRSVELIGDSKLADLYAVALKVFGVQARTHNPKDMALTGLCNFHSSL